MVMVTNQAQYHQSWRFKYNKLNCKEQKREQKREPKHLRIKKILYIRIQAQKITNTNPAAVSIAQLLKFNSINHTCMQDISQSVSVRHNSVQETPLPTYIGLMLHAHTRNKKLIDRFYHLGMSIFYDRVLSLSATMGPTVCKQFHREQVVCPPKLHGSVFTTAAVDNIDYNPSSTTSKELFNGTGFSLLQHITCDGEGRDQSIVLAGESYNTSYKSVDHLPHFYTDVSPVTKTYSYRHYISKQGKLRSTN